MYRRHFLTAAMILARSLARSAAEAAPQLTISWEENFLTIRGDFPGREISIHYLEAYCRPGSVDREWGHTVIKHTTQLVRNSKDGRVIQLHDELADGVVVDHTITAGVDDIDFQLVARNATARASEAYWAQPCLRVDRFTGMPTTDARARQPQYIRQCFLFIDGQLTRLPTKPWADNARYIPGQVYVPKHVDRTDVNPRPLSALVPSSGLCGCFAANEKSILAVAWEPYQEIFQGVITCLHNDFRIGGLAPGEVKRIRGKLYILPNDVPMLVERFERDFPEQRSY